MISERTITYSFYNPHFLYQLHDECDFEGVYLKKAGARQNLLICAPTGDGTLACKTGQCSPALGGDTNNFTHIHIHIHIPR